MQPTEKLPISETQGKGELEFQGNCLGNLPPVHDDYVRRQLLEEELGRVLSDDRHPVVTLVGRGGIGKTWLALRVLHGLTTSERFATMIWFSARDIDLLPQGPKQVTAHILNQDDLAREYMRLVEFEESPPSSKEASKRFVRDLQGKDGEPTLFILDNFETVRNPLELYTWLDTYIRPPNKILITTRFREFKGDYPVEVAGMTESECHALIDSAVKKLGIVKLVKRGYRAELIKESDGHPYVIRMLLGEVAKTRIASKPRRIIAGNEDILDALFERTFLGLSPVARRIFMTLSCWHSTVPVLGLEAALLREENEKMDVQGGIEELSKSSMVEISRSSADGQLFVSIPLVALSFGEKKLLVSPMKSAIQADLEILQAFGAAQHTGIQHGIRPRIRRLFLYVAQQIEKGDGSLQQHTPMLEFVGRGYPEAWLMLADLQEEQGELESAKNSVRRFLEREPGGSSTAWTRLQNLCVKTEDWSGQAHALLEISELPEADLQKTSSCANTLNWLLHEGKLRLDTDEKRVVMTRMVRLMEERIEEFEATGDDYSRLAWLYLHLGRKKDAGECAHEGLQVDSQNEHCLRLLDRLGSP
ncbi:MAG: NB-ARC domain-containing protein [Candidatus Bipolaricaulia bacterium]